MEVELLSPSVKHGGEAQIAAQVIASELQECLGRAIEEQRVKPRGIEQDQSMELFGQREDAVVIGDRQ